MSAEVELLKKLVNNGLLVDAVELPTLAEHGGRKRALIGDDLEDAIGHFEEDSPDYAHFVVRVKRSTQPLPKPHVEEQPPQLTIDSMVNETLALAEQISAASPQQQIQEPLTVESTQEEEYDPQFLMDNAKILEDANDFPLARNIYQTLIRRGSLIPESLAGLARCFEKEGRLEKAIRCYQEAIAYSSELAFYQCLAAIQIRQGHDEDAAETLLHALGISTNTDDQRFELHKSIGNCYTRLADYSRAEHHYRKAFEIEPDSDVLQVNVGSLALQKNDYESALSHFQRALEINTKNEKAISGLGMVYLARNNIADAHDKFVESLQLNLNNLGAIYNLVKCAYDLKRFDDASTLLKKYIETNPVNMNILYSYAGILFHQGNLEAAEAEVAKILASNGTHAGAIELLELIRVRRTRS